MDLCSKLSRHWTVELQKAADEGILAPKSFPDAHCDLIERRSSSGIPIWHRDSSWAYIMARVPPWILRGVKSDSWEVIYQYKVTKIALIT
ncbi:hypothetical protein AFLA70_188g002181 [Aspergillus flavus AF70]|nr:hypothetical protein AFLA70_188g002181 [Aspergillus flavus AF70]